MSVRRIVPSQGQQARRQGKELSKPALPPVIHTYQTCIRGQWVLVKVYGKPTAMPSFKVHKMPKALFGIDPDTIH